MRASGFLLARYSFICVNDLVGWLFVVRAILVLPLAGILFNHHHHIRSSKDREAVILGGEMRVSLLQVFTLCVNATAPHAASRANVSVPVIPPSAFFRSAVVPGHFIDAKVNE